MAEQDDGDRTESATPKRRAEARKEGQVARSSEVNSTLVLLAGVATTFVGLAWMGDRVRRAGLFFFQEAARPAVDSPADGARMISLFLRQTAEATAPVLAAVLVVGTLSALLQVGWNFSLQALSFKFQKLNPLEGVKKLVSKQMLFELGKNLLKVTLLAAVAILAIRPSLPKLLGLSGIEGIGGWAVGAEFIWLLVLRMIAVLAVLAAFDLWWQRHRYEEQLKMTKQEVRREAKDSEGDPQVRARIKSMMLEMARQRMMDDVKTADVVLTNPTHYSVALKYDGKTPAPKVVAKGQGFLALRIREIAREAGVPVLENPPLARALHRVVKVGDMIPTDLYEAVAQVLATVYRTKRRAAAAAGGV